MIVLLFYCIIIYLYVYNYGYICSYVYIYLNINRSLVAKVGCSTLSGCLLFIYPLIFISRPVTKPRLISWNRHLTIVRPIHTENFVGRFGRFADDSDDSYRSNGGTMSELVYLQKKDNNIRKC